MWIFKALPSATYGKCRTQALRLGKIERLLIGIFMGVFANPASLFAQTENGDIYEKVIARSAGDASSLRHFVLAQTEQTAANTSDILAPSILHKMEEESIIRGQKYRVEATITDDAKVQSATLFFRTAGDQVYTAVQMKKHAGSNTYSAYVPPQRVLTPGIEYYLEAKDDSDNIALRGYAFSPLKIDVVSSLQQMADTSPKKPAKKAGGFSAKWLWIGIGAVAVAGLAGAGGGGDSNPSDDSADLDITVPVP